MKTLGRTLAVALLAASLVAIPLVSHANHRVIRATEEPNKWDAGSDPGNQSYLHVTPGTRVVWKNRAANSQSHDVTAYGRNWNMSNILQPGEQTARRFRNAGTYKYRCRLHSHMVDGACRGMCGVVHVGN